MFPHYSNITPFHYSRHRQFFVDIGAYRPYIDKRLSIRVSGSSTVGQATPSALRNAGVGEDADPTYDQLPRSQGRGAGSASAYSLIFLTHFLYDRLYSFGIDGKVASPGSRPGAPMTIPGTFCETISEGTVTILWIYFLVLGFIL